ncbi:MAG: hypothetical protein Q8P51_01535, partial [Ignavibacteria bacterium]|nr:hypothetical protein [Ignavibacteria bacterium]
PFGLWDVVFFNEGGAFNHTRGPSTGAQNPLSMCAAEGGNTLTSMRKGGGGENLISGGRALAGDTSALRFKRMY